MCYLNCSKAHYRSAHLGGSTLFSNSRRALLEHIYTCSLSACVFCNYSKTPKSVAVPGSHQSPLAVNHVPWQSKECAGRPGQRRGEFPLDDSSGKHTSSKQEPAKLLPALHFRWLSTPAVPVNANQGTTESPPCAVSCTLNFMALTFSVQNSV